MSNLYNNFDDYLIGEARYWGSPTERTKDVLDAFSSTREGNDLYALGVRTIPERNEVRFERRSRGESMPKTGIWKDGGKFHIAHYSSKPGLEVYGEKTFDTVEEAFRHLWIRIAKNIIPASIMSRREVEKRVNFDELFPIGSGLSQSQFLEIMRPIMGGEELAHPSNDDLLGTDTIQKLLELAVIGKKDRYGNGGREIIVRDISKNLKVKYNFYCHAAQTVCKMYLDLIKKILGDSIYNRCHGVLTSRYTDYESWTVTNTNRIPVNAVNFRTGENTAKFNVQSNEMMSAVFLAIIKRTFSRAKGNNFNEKLIWSSGQSSELVTELNTLLSNYFFDAASTLEPSVFVEKEFIDHPQVLENAHALLIKYLLKEGSMDLKGAITTNPDLKELVDFSTSREDIDELTKRLIKASKLLKYI
jgi:hypothetical protein